MTTMSPAETDALWEAIEDQRRRTADLLEGLSPDQWEHPSLCEGWRVRDVAAHLTMQEQRVRDALAFVGHHPRLLRRPSLNAVIHDSAVVRAGELSTREMIARVRSTPGSRLHNPGVTPLETLTDILVHSQDIAIPLGLDLQMRPDAAAVAATRRWDTRSTWMGAVNRRLPLDGHRLTATDVEWARGEGPEVAGPIAALLLLLTGRPVGLERLTGDGADALRAAVAADA